MTTSSGSARNKRGAATESLLEAHHRVAAMLRTAYLVKRPTPWKPLRPVSGGMLCVPERVSGVDYAGVLAGGRAVFVEAKRHTGGPFPLARIEPQQLEEMRQIQAVSPRAARILAIEWFPTAQRDLVALGLLDGLSVLVAMSWAVVDEAIASGSKSIPPAKLLEHRVARDAKTYLESWKED